MKTKLSMCFLFAIVISLYAQWTRNATPELTSGNAMIIGNNLIFRNSTIEFQGYEYPVGPDNQPYFPHGAIEVGQPFFDFNTFEFKYSNNSDTYVTIQTGLNSYIGSGFAPNIGGNLLEGGPDNLLRMDGNEIQTQAMKDIPPCLSTTGEAMSP